MCWPCNACHFYICNDGYLFDFASTYVISTPVILIFSSFFIQNHISPIASTKFISKDAEFSCASCPLTQTHTQMLKSGFSVLSSQEIGSRLISFQMILNLFQLFRFQYHIQYMIYCVQKILKIPEFNLRISFAPTYQHGYEIVLWSLAKSYHRASLYASNIVFSNR